MNENKKLNTALKFVKRKHFLTSAILPENSSIDDVAEKDIALPLKFDKEGKPLSSITQPSLVTKMLEFLNIKSGDKVMEIGTGSGYNAALIAFLVGKEGMVYSVDCEKDVIQQAEKSIRFAGFEHEVKLFSRDAWFGVEEHAPFNAIICTAGCSTIPLRWFKQLKTGGQIIIPMMFRGLTFVCEFVKKRDRLVGKPVIPCNFMPLRGKLFNPNHQPLYMNKLSSYLKEFNSEKLDNNFLLTNPLSWNIQFQMYLHTDNQFRVLLEKQPTVKPDYSTHYAFGKFLSKDQFWIIQKDRVFFSSQRMLNNFNKTQEKINLTSSYHFPEISFFFDEENFQKNNILHEYDVFYPYSKENIIAFKA